MTRKSKNLPAQKIKITDMSGLIHTDTPELSWRNEQTGQLEQCRKKLIYAEELYQALGLANSHRARSISKWKACGFENIDWNERIIPGKNRNFSSAYLRVEFAKKICMQINTPIADAVRDYLIKETAAFWSAAKRQALALANPIPQQPLQISDAVRKVVEKAVTEAVAIAVQETNERNQAASKTLYNQKFALLNDMREEHTDQRNKANLRAHISNMVRKHCFEHGEDYKLFWEKCYNSFKIRHKSCDWYSAFCMAHNKVQFIAENLPIKYLQEFHEIVVSYLLEYR
jgi:phage anti-repressor protein